MRAVYCVPQRAVLWRYRGKTLFRMKPATALNELIEHWQIPTALKKLGFAGAISVGVPLGKT